VRSTRNENAVERNRYASVAVAQPRYFFKESHLIPNFDFTSSILSNDYLRMDFDVSQNAWAAQRLDRAKN